MRRAVRIAPATLSGCVRVPPSKSLGHRALICAALAGNSTVYCPGDSDDIAATRRGLAQWGAVWQPQDDGLRAVRPVRPGDGSGELVTVDCGESGSTLRFLLPLALALGRPTRFVGRGLLGSRPLDAYTDLMRRQGLPFERGEGSGLDLTVSGRLRPDVFTLPGNVSSQFITGLLLALPLLDGPARVEVAGRLESRGYVDLTRQAMAAFGVRVDVLRENVFLPAPGGYRPADYTVEGDYSQAAFFLAAGALAGLRSSAAPPLWIAGLRPDSLQGDREAATVLSRMGATLSWDGDGRLACTARRLRGCVIDAAQIPDVIPVLAVAACAAEGETRILNAGRLRLKECDRLQATAAELTRLGAAVTEEADGLIITGRPGGLPFAGGCAADSHADHRMAMTLAVAAAGCAAPFTLSGPECVSKSYPAFWEEYRRLGGSCDEFAMGNETETVAVR